MNYQSSFPALPILIVDDEEAALDSFEMSLVSYGIDNILTCNDPRQVKEILENQEVEAVLLDLAMPYISGEELLKMIMAQYPHIPVIIVTGFNEVEKAVSCIRKGAFDYLVKPIEGGQLASRLRHATDLRELRRENTALKNSLISTEIKNPWAFENIVTASPIMFSLFRYIEAVAPSSQCILITGETGTGKELFARAIHDLSGRNGDLVAINVAGLDDEMFSDTLFGHKKGAFTNAIETRKGLVEKAHGGTLFLDEIGDMQMASQVKLLRLLQENEYIPLGSDEPKISSARIIAATNKNMDILLKSGEFRADLFYRLSTHKVHIPPLRERLKDDITPLTDHFIRISAQSLNLPLPSISKNFYACLESHDFPGNIRELESMIHDLMSCYSPKGQFVLGQKMLGDDMGPFSPSSFSFSSLAHARDKNLDFPKVESDFGEFEDSDFSGVGAYTCFSSDIGENKILFPSPLPTIRKVTNLLIKEALLRTQGNQAAAAAILGITPSALSQRLKKGLK